MTSVKESISGVGGAGNLALRQTPLWQDGGGNVTAGNATSPLGRRRRVRPTEGGLFHQSQEGRKP